MSDSETTGLTAKELCEKYPALGGYPIICRLMCEGTLAPFKMLKSFGSNKYHVDPIRYSNFGLDRRDILGKPVGDILISACDRLPYDGPYLYDPSQVVFKTSAITKLLEAYPDIPTSKMVLFQIDRNTGEIVHAKQTPAPSSTQPAMGTGDISWLFAENKRLQKELKKAHEDNECLHKVIEGLEQEKGGAARTQVARDKQAEKTASNWMKQLKVAVELPLLLTDKWANRKGNEPWAQEGFTNNEIKNMADSLGGLTQNGRRAFKEVFTRCYPDVPLKTSSGARRS